MSAKSLQKSIGRDAAIALAETKWWIGRSDREVAKIGLFTQELCLPFDVLHEAVEKALGRPVWTHEFGSDGLYLEFIGEKDAPTMEEILNLIPADKRIVIHP